jgi:hypothetical protein
MYDRFIQGFDEEKKNKIIQKLMMKISEIYDPIRETSLDRPFPQQPTPDMSRFDYKQPGGNVPQFFNSDMPNVVTTRERPPERTEVAQRLFGVAGEIPESLGAINTMFGDYFKPETAAHGAIPEGGSYFTGSRVIQGNPKTGTVAPGAAVTRGGVIGERNPSSPVSVAPGNALVQPSSTPGTPAAPVYTNTAAEPSMYAVETDNDGNVTVMRKDTGEVRKMKGIGKATAGPARYHYGANEQGELVQIDTITGQPKTISGVFGPEWLKMTFDQRNKTTDHLYAQLLDKFMDGKATDVEIETLNMLTDMKSKQGILMMLQSASETGKLPGPTPRPWEQPKEAPPPAPPKKGLFDFLNKAPDITITPDTSGRPKFRQPGQQAPGAAAPAPEGANSYKFSVGKENYSLGAPAGKPAEAVKADIDQISDALKAGATINEILTVFETNGYTVTRPGSSPGPHGAFETILKR